MKKKHHTHFLIDLCPKDKKKIIRLNNDRLSGYIWFSYK